ncbi:probable galactinol--sucrose galactosyltransferase 6 isoform X1 [Phoenix dactylifera]|uniref:galactinol--sucrose galactosyltransferase n=2 Tax=Phoenix dactylifera TaxID=42345 RepID=A0A8B7CUV6_PHODC|nr:probable galactinol--sucrose galactosyltransferase 6 isoform X1 [Phoenix dactylifera]
MGSACTCRGFSWLLLSPSPIPINNPPLRSFLPPSSFLAFSSSPPRSLALLPINTKSSLFRFRSSSPIRCSSSTLSSSKGSGLESSVVEKARKKEEGKEGEMTITPSVRISDGKLVVRGHAILSGVPDAVISSPAASSGPVDGVFLGAQFAEPSCRHVLPLGTLRDVRFMASFRFKLWWMAQTMGDRGRDIPHETQFLLVESMDGEETVYTVLLPLIEGPFRACLQGNPRDELELCLESGDADTRSASFSHSLFVGSAVADPFAAISGAVAAVKHHLKTFLQRPEKKLPGIVDYFGWCTWDAFYQEVTQEGVEAGLRSLTAGGAPPKFVIIDDGWQSVGSDQPQGEYEKPNSLLRLTGIKANNKFQSKEDPAAGINTIVQTAKSKYGLKYVYVWHAITGYWGGVQPGVEAMEEYGSKMQYPKIPPGVVENEPWMMTDAITLQGLGLVNPRRVYKFYNELHSYLAADGVDGVKVDVQCILETLGAGLGGRVELTRQYHRALDASVAKNFPDNGCIACMSHNTDALYCSKQTAVVRASDDFYPRDPVSHTIHIASVAYNSVFLGEFMLPDWDMFHSLHPAAEYHASARAISGGPIYVSDAPGKHNFELLRKLVLPDGSILRARLPGRPTRDCLFSDPARDGVSLLKIWNMNKFNGVLGVYNCQGAAWSSTEKKNMFHHTRSDALSCAAKGSDVHLIAEAATDHDWHGDCVVYRHRDGQLVVLPHNAAMPVSLKVLEHDIFTISPIKDLAPGFRFAPLGLVDMFNAGGAVDGLTYHILGGANILELDSSFAGEMNGAFMRSLEKRSGDAVALICMEVKGCGRLGTYSSVKPRRCMLGSADAEFSYEPSSGFLTLQLENMPEGNKRVHKVAIEL